MDAPVRLATGENPGEKHGKQPRLADKRKITPGQDANKRIIYRL